MSHKPCPFCGKDHSGSEAIGKSAYWISCYECEANGPSAETEGEAWRKWDERQS